MYFREIIDRQNLVYTFDLPTADKGYTYYDMLNGSKSCIDRFSVHNSLCDSVSVLESVVSMIVEITLYIHNVISV